MPPNAVSVISRATTEHVAPAERIDYWEEYNRRELVGLSCRSYSDSGLLASQTNIRLADVRLAHIAGNAHVIERTPQMARSTPKDSVFASLLLRGEAVFLHENGCLAATAGDLVLYDTRRPYLFGFSSSMGQILVDIPREVFTEVCLPGGVPVPTLFGRGSVQEGRLVSSLRSLLGDLVAMRGGHSPEETRQAVLGLIRLLALERSGGPASPPAQLLTAKEHIERHLHDPRLNAAEVARTLGISVRQLSRVFEPAGTTPARYILDRRLERAAAELSAPGAAGTRIADVAYRWGFSSQAHFARVFRGRYGRTPREARAGLTGMPNS
ncbi:helix-turn-helix domain-containing protein [Sphaerisporangium fuscum]|uniref:helix-turn-helix domain-containing protein n=1 Tax=Sphaerisporangium fuscum TaxID=2835868 RepID=UPI001BDD1FB4|nr:helix-turn-helix domain-containing protein [Sphaerisporangium fuscum]